MCVTYVQGGSKTIGTVYTCLNTNQNRSYLKNLLCKIGYLSSRILHHDVILVMTNIVRVFVGTGVIRSAQSGRGTLIPAREGSAANGRRGILKYKIERRVLCCKLPSIRLYLINDNYSLNQNVRCSMSHEFGEKKMFCSNSVSYTQNITAKCYFFSQQNDAGNIGHSTR